MSYTAISLARADTSRHAIATVTLTRVTFFAADTIDADIHAINAR